MQKSPLAIVQKEHGDKAKLVAAVQAFAKDSDLWLDRLNADKGLARVSNAKLLRLVRLLTEVKGRFGTRAKLIDAVLEGQKRSKDTGLRVRLEAYPVPRLYDLYRSQGGAASVSTKGASSPAKAAADSASTKAAPAAKAVRPSASKQAAARPVAAAAGAASKAKPAASGKTAGAAVAKASTEKGKDKPAAATGSKAAAPAASAKTKAAAAKSSAKA